MSGSEFQAKEVGNGSSGDGRGETATLTSMIEEMSR